MLYKFFCFNIISNKPPYGIIINMDIESTLKFFSEIAFGL